MVSQELNHLLVKLLFASKLATKEQIQSVWGKSAEKNVAELLVEAGVVTAQIAVKVVQHAEGLLAQPAPSAETVPESSIPEAPFVVGNTPEGAVGFDETVPPVPGLIRY
jgi:hypothetical protein